MTSPLFSVNQDSKNRSIILRERLHNGNVLNAVVGHYLEIDDDMRFVEMFDVEEKYLYISPEIDENDTYIIHRDYKYGTVYCSLFINQNKELEIGHFEIDSKTKTAENRVILNADYEQYLVTGRKLICE